MLSPDSKATQNIMLKDVSVYACAHITPQGHETLAISSIPISEAKSSDEALILLNKVEECCYHEWSLTNWTERDAEVSLKPNYKLLYDTKTNVSSDSEYTLMNDFLRIAFNLSQERNSNFITCHPSKKLVDNLRLTNLKFVHPKNLIYYFVSSRTENFFLKDDYQYYLVSWYLTA
jgi:hypothetical protein